MRVSRERVCCRALAISSLPHSACCPAVCFDCATRCCCWKTLRNLRLPTLPILCGSFRKALVAPQTGPPWTPNSMSAVAAHVWEARVAPPREATGHPGNGDATTRSKRSRLAATVICTSITSTHARKACARLTLKAGVRPLWHRRRRWRPTFLRLHL